jgi:hypothetical protein
VIVWDPSRRERAGLVNNDREEGHPIAGSISVALPHLVQIRLSATERPRDSLGDSLPVAGDMCRPRYHGWWKYQQRRLR